MISVFTGTMSGKALGEWLGGDKMEKWLNDKPNIYALVEYVHRYVFGDKEMLINDLSGSEAAEYSLKGRIFWKEGQMEWRSSGGGQFSVVFQTEDDLPGGQEEDKDSVQSGIDRSQCLPLPKNLQFDAEMSKAIVGSRERMMILWGTRSDAGPYLEQRVAGSRPIDYPGAITESGKNYPVLVVKEYLGEEGDTLIWRLVEPGTRNQEDLPPGRLF